jgi:hypothetical protein
MIVGDGAVTFIETSCAGLQFVAFRAVRNATFPRDDMLAPHGRRRHSRLRW